MSLLSIILRNLPTFSTLKADDKVLVARKTPKLDGLVSLQKILDAVTVTWDTISGKPSTFLPSTHGHPFSALTSLPATIAGHGITDVAPPLQLTTTPFHTVTSFEFEQTGHPERNGTYEYLGLSTEGNAVWARQGDGIAMSFGELSGGGLLFMLRYIEDTYAWLLYESESFVADYGTPLIDTSPTVIETPEDYPTPWSAEALLYDIGDDGGAVTTFTLSAPDAIVGQPAFVTHSDGTMTSWIAAADFWLPTTSGVIWDADALQWLRLSWKDGTLDKEPLPDQ